VLEGPPRSLAKQPLARVEVDPFTLLRVTRFEDGEPHFGRTGGNRFDDFRRPGRSRFGTCYAGLSLRVAFAETILHDAEPADGKFEMARATVASRYVAQFAGERLVLADLTGVALKRAGIDPSLTTVANYALPQRWAVAVHEHPQEVDGILYMSRHVNTDPAVVVFERARRKLVSTSYTPLLDFPGALATVLAFGDLIG
jgi:hypothetical protein